MPAHDVVVATHPLDSHHACLHRSFAGVDIALFSAGGSISKKFGPIAQAAGAVVVDNSSAFRMTQGVPLVIPEVNPDAMAHVRVGGGGAIIANPNCSTIIALMAVTPLHRLAKVKRMVVSTYQAASGAGAAAMEELRDQTRDVLEGKPAKPVIFPYQACFAAACHHHHHHQHVITARCRRCLRAALHYTALHAAWHLLGA
jgi:aspartate-semialdehyde dehydrogenase